MVRIYHFPQIPYSYRYIGYRGYIGHIGYIGYRANIALAAKNEFRVRAHSAKPFPWNLPLPEFIEYAVKKCDNVKYDQQQFFLVRQLRSYFPQNTTAEDAFAQVLPILQKWPNFDAETAMAYLVDTWGKIRFRETQTPLEQAAARAARTPLVTPRGQRFNAPTYDRFVSIAGWLQVLMGDKDILLPCGKTADLMKTTKNMVSIWRRWAIEDGYLVLVEQHKFNTDTKFASKFRFNVRQWKCLSSEAQNGTAISFDLAGYSYNQLSE